MRTSKINPWVFSGLLLAVLLLLLEAGVRWAGFVPGDVSPEWANFKQVDALIVHDDFVVNGEGILVANASRHVVYGRNVNSDGFHSPEFTEVDSTRSTVMLIGDSFTWGMSASDMDSSFASILRKNSGRNIHNLGIPAADPVQYALIAEHYVPKLRPDAVLVFFFMGNDMMLQDREPAPFRDFYYFTNAGALWTDWDGREFPDPNSAYDYFLNEKYFLSGQRNLMEWVVSKSAVLSRLYSVRFRLEEKLRWERQIKDMSLTNSYLLKVRETALQHGAEFRIIVIPERKEAEMNREDYEERYSSFFRHPELRPQISWPETRKDYFKPYPDAHLNDRGHAVYAAFLLELLEGS